MTGFGPDPAIATVDDLDPSATKLLRPARRVRTADRGRWERGARIPRSGRNRGGRISYGRLSEMDRVVKERRSKEQDYSRNIGSVIFAMMRRLTRAGSKPVRRGCGDRASAIGHAIFMVLASITPVMELAGNAMPAPCSTEGHALRPHLLPARVALPLLRQVLHEKVASPAVRWLDGGHADQAFAHRESPGWAPAHSRRRSQKTGVHAEAFTLCSRRRSEEREGSRTMAAAPGNLKELYTADMRDLWSANDQMQKIVQEFREKATDPKVKQLFERSVTGIGEHTQELRQMIDAEDPSPCAGMQGLVEEARRHALQSDLQPQLRDLEMITQYQRMSHYGIAGFGTVAAYADALGISEKANKLRSIVSDIYRGDEYASQLAESAQRAATRG